MNPFSIKSAYVHAAAVLLATLAACVTASAFLHAADVASRIQQTSDSVQSFVAAHAVLSGNVLLTGWRLPVDNYFATDTLAYVALEWLFGPKPLLLVIAPALTYALLVLAAALACAFAAQSLRKRIEGILIVAFLLACPVWVGNWDPILFSDFHVGSTLGAFLALLLCALTVARAGPGQNPAVAGGALILVTATTVASDPFSIVFAFGPALVVLVPDAAMRNRAATFGLAALGSGIAIGLLLPAIIASVGHGLAIEAKLSLGFGAFSRIPETLLALLCGLLNYFGANLFERQGGGGVFLGLRLLAFALAVIATCDAALRMVGRRRAPLLDRLLCAGIMTLFAACILSAKFGKPVTAETVLSGSDSDRYLVPAVFFSAALAGRRLPSVVEILPGEMARRAMRGLIAALAVLAVVGGDWPSRMIESQPRWIEANSAQEVARWLKRHELAQGVGEFWSANLITALSGETVQIRSVAPYRGKVIPDVWASDSRSYDRIPQFVIWEQPNQGRLTYEAVRATYAICASGVIAGYHIALLSDRADSYRCRKVFPTRP